MKIHPIIWRKVVKMYGYVSIDTDDIKLILDHYGIKYDNKKYSAYSIFSQLSPSDSITIINDVLNIPDFWISDLDNTKLRNSEIQSRNQFIRSLKLQQSYSSTFDPYTDIQPTSHEIEEHKSWGEELSGLLKTYHGILYDKKTNTLSFENTERLHIIPQIINNEILISYTFDDYFLNEIVKDINGTYKASYFTASLFLLRKLFENCLLILLENKFPRTIPGNLDLYYDVSKGRNRDFSELIQAIRNKSNELGMRDEVDRLLNRIGHLKDITNPIVHKLVYKGSIKEIKEIHITEILELLKKIDSENALGIKLKFT